MAQLADTPQMSNETAHKITMRSIGIGILVSMLASAWVTYARTGSSTSAVNITHLPVSHFALFLIVFFTNAFYKTRLKRPGLQPSELAVIFAMGLVGALIPARGLTGIWLGLMSAPYYLATPENGWIELVQPHLPTFLFPTNEGFQTRFLYEGLPTGAAIPWNVWIAPLFWWSALILAGFTTCICVVVILRKQWVENERLDYPLVAPVLEMLEEDNEGWPEFFRNGFFWAGFCLAFGIIAWNMVTYFQPNWPRINTSPNGGLFYFARQFPPLLTHINTYTIGFAYFVKLEILFSIWIFHLILMSEIAIIRKVGFQFGRLHQAGGSWSDPLVQWQCVGALFAFVGWGLWTARHHFQLVWRKAIHNDQSIDDSQELISYRAALAGLVVSTIFIIGWLHQAGVDISMIAITVPATFVIYIALARFVCESGTLYLGIPTSPLDMGKHLIGTEVLSSQTITAASTSHALRWMLFMPALSQGAKVLDHTRASKRNLLLALFLGLVAALAINIFLVLYMGYTHGAYNFTEYPFTRYAPSLYDSIVTTIKTPEPASWERMVLFGIGGAIMLVLTILRYRLPWWPLHPVGFIITTTSILHEITSLFIVWMFKAIVVRVGGVALYRKFRPLFFGIIVGRTAGVLLSFIVDYIWFPGAGHSVHGWA